VKHLLKTMKEKEEVVDTLKADLEVKQNQMEADKSLQESRSDRESVISSLTSASGKGHRSSGNGKNNDSNSKKRKQQGSSKHRDSGSTSKKHRTSNSRNTSSESTGEETSGGEDRVSRGPSTQDFSFDNTISSVSDITSNQGSSSISGSNSGSSSEDRRERAGETKYKQQPSSSSSASEDAALKSGGGGHGDVVFDNDKKSKRKRRPTEVTSLERSFELDFEEVFDKSNIPQVIAATSGKIVSCKFAPPYHTIRLSSCF
jgi:hypothetical protein